ncbi:MAG: hypothetical protein R6T99_08880 [Bacteroidales bacterium]
MKLIFKLLTLAVIMAAGTTSAMAEIQITIYGKGGMVNGPGGSVIICPNASSEECAKLILPDDIVGIDGTVICGTLNYDGKSTEVEVMDLPELSRTPAGYSCQSIVVKGLNP